MKVVASDLGRYEREAWVENVTIAPAERYMVDVRFDEAGDVSLVNRVRAIDHIMARFFEETHVLGVVHVAARRPRPIIARASSSCARTPRSRRDRALSAALRPPGRPRAARHAGGRRPAVPAAPAAQSRIGLSQSRRVERDDAGDGLDGHGPERRAGCCATHDRRENMDIDWRFRVGDVVKLRLVNDRERAACDAAPDAHPRTALSGPGGQRRAEREPRVERHGAPADRLRRGHAAGGDESGHVDAALPYRRAHRDRHADGVRGDTDERRRMHLLLSSSCLVARRLLPAQPRHRRSSRTCAVRQRAEPVVALTNVRVVDGTGAAAASKGRRS